MDIYGKESARSSAFRLLLTWCELNWGLKALSSGTGCCSVEDDAVSQKKWDGRQNSPISRRALWMMFELSKYNGFYVRSPHHTHRSKAMPSAFELSNGSNLMVLSGSEQSRRWGSSCREWSKGHDLGNYVLFPDSFSLFFSHSFSFLPAMKWDVPSATPFYLPSHQPKSNVTS